MKYRHKVKHSISYGDYHILQNRLKTLHPTDKKANLEEQYKVRSIYFDNYHDLVLTEKLIGINQRLKYLIRYYNDNPDFIRLEKKIKSDGLYQKMTAPLTITECEQILIGDIDFLKLSSHALHQEFFNEMVTKFIKPKTIVDYTRETYVYPNVNVKITFDMTLKSGETSTDFLNTDLATVHSLDAKCVILEIKYNEYLPQFIADFIQTKHSQATAISKKVSYCQIAATSAS